MDFVLHMAQIIRFIKNNNNNNDFSKNYLLSFILYLIGKLLQNLMVALIWKLYKQ